MRMLLIYPIGCRAVSTTACTSPGSSLIDDDGTMADLLDISRVVRGQKNGDALLRVQLPDQVADALLGDNIQPDGWLVQLDRGSLSTS